jgi:predicted  nucleic acid-binding Zn-ribbon protein
MIILLTRMLGLSLLLGTLTASAEDLDIERAQSTYDARKAETDAAASVVQREEALLAPYFNRIDQAKQRVNQAENSLNRLRGSLSESDRIIAGLQREISNLQSTVQRLEDEGIRLQDQLSEAERIEDRLLAQIDQKEREIERLERRIRELENSPREGMWTCVYVDRGWEEHSGGHRGRHANREEAAAKAEEACKAVHGNCALSECTQPESNQLEELRRQLSEARDDHRQLVSQLRQVQSDISEYKRRINDIRSDIRQAQNQIREKQLDLDSARRNREEILLDIEQARTDLDRAQSDLSIAESDLSRARGPYDRAVAECRRAKSASDAAWQYLQQVIANYNRAKQRVIDVAKAAGQEHGAKEAAGRGTTDGQANGSTDGRGDGEVKGSSDGKLLSGTKGYRDGRNHPGANAGSAQAYDAGKVDGKNWATEKARLENLPLGFNSAFANLLKATPVNAESIDISEEISTSPGSNARDLTGANLAVGNKAAPATAIPADPIAQPPQNRQPRINTPQPNQTEAQPPCENLPRPEFHEMCRQEYSKNYVESFGLKYRTLYVPAYTAAYNQIALSAYQEKFGQNYPESYNTGLLNGAREAGVLVGYSESIAAAQTEQYAAGEARFQSELGNAYLLALRSSELVDANGDGVIVPGESIKLKLVIDNLGNEASPLAKFKLKVQEVAGAGELSVQVRELPALNPNTRTTLIGVVKAKNLGTRAGDRIQLKGALLSGELEISAIENNTATHFPIELVDLKLDRSPRVNEKVDTTAVFKNMSNAVQSADVLNIFTTPQYVKVEGVPLKVAEMQPGATSEFRIKLTPGVWVGETSPVSFHSAVQNAEGQTLLTQIFDKTIDVKRSAVIELLDLNGRPLPNPLVVRAGSRARIRAQVKFKDTQTRPGPFVLRYTRTNPETIRPSNNSTVSSNYGSLGPNSRPSPIDFSFDIPANLKGQKGFIMLQLDEGAAAIHAPQVSLDIQ